MLAIDNDTGGLNSAANLATPGAIPLRGLSLLKASTARERIAAGESPFRVHADKILGCHSTALRLQALVLSLYNSQQWHKKVPVRLDDLFAAADEDHCEAAIDMLRSYGRRGENDADFMALGKHLATRRLTAASKGGRA